MDPLVGAGWNDFVEAAVVIVITLVWVIMRFGVEKMKPKDVAQQRPKAPAAPAAQPARDPLKAEIDEFLRQAQALREGKAPARQRPAAAEGREGRPARRPSKRAEPRPVTPAAPTPVAVDVSENAPARESVSEHVAHHLGGLKFEKRESQLSSVPAESDSEFAQHMQRVFSHDVGKLKSAGDGIFGAAAAAAAATGSAAAEPAQAARSATAPVVIRKNASDIAMFLASRKNVRDAIILNEILRRPDERW